MSETIQASNGVRLPVNDLEQTIVYNGSLVSTISVIYQGVTYVQTFTYLGNNINTISQWTPA